MAVIRKTLDALRADPPRLSEEARNRLLAMTDEEIEAAALADPNNPPWTDEMVARARRERDERKAILRTA